MLVFILLSLTAFSGFLDRIKSEIKWKEEEKPIFENVTVYSGKNVVQEKILPGSYEVYLFELNYPNDIYGKIKFIKEFSEFLENVESNNNKKYSILLTQAFYNDILEMRSRDLMQSEYLLKVPASSLNYQQIERLNELTKEIKVKEYKDTDQEKLNRQIYVLYKILEKKGFIESNVYTELDKENLIEEINAGRQKLINRYRNTSVDYYLKEDYSNIDLKDFSDEAKYKFEKDIILSTNIEDQALFPDIHLNIYIANFDPKIIEELAKKQIKLKRRILILDNDLYHGYTYNEENTVVFVNGKSPLYYFPDYKIDVKVVRTDVNKLKNYDSKYKIGDFFY